MNFRKVFTAVKRILLLLISALMLPVMSLPAAADEISESYQEIAASHEDAEFTYELMLTDGNGMPVTNPRKLKVGDTIHVEIRLTRENFNSPNYDSYGIEFRLLTRGLTFNYDGMTLRGGTDVRLQSYSDGDAVGFAWYDMNRVGEKFNNPVMAASWSYIVQDPSKVNITVPVALIYITGDEKEYIPVGSATLFLDSNGGKIIGNDVSGTYTSGTSVTLPSVEMGEWVFAGWSDGVNLYPAGSEYIVSGIVTLTAEWEELVRNRHVKLDLKGGELEGEDISGFYADGEIITLPEASREGYKFLGWNDGAGLYDAGTEYTVYNTVILVAEWEILVPTDSDETEDMPTDSDESDESSQADQVQLTNIVVAASVTIGGLGLLWLLLLWKRSFVMYSLITGDVSLYFKNGNAPAEVDVVLYDGAKEYHLNRSGKVEVRHRLRFIQNVTNMMIADVKPGTYKGKLHIHLGSEEKVKKCRIKVLDRELDNKYKN